MRECARSGGVEGIKYRDQLYLFIKSMGRAVHILLWKCHYMLYRNCLPVEQVPHVKLARGPLDFKFEARQPMILLRSITNVACKKECAYQNLFSTVQVNAKCIHR